MTCDVLVVGGGPAGSAAARRLAGQGVRVVLADRRRFPRDKVCGDGLISDALGALTTLGLRERVLRQAVHARQLSLYAPAGCVVPLRGDFACVPRARLDAELWTAAREAGATILEEVTARGPLDTAGRVTGARFSSARGAFEVRAEVTLLATGANAAALRDFGLPHVAAADAVAGRAYFEAPADVAAKYPDLMIVYRREWCPGYGWVFPSPGNRFNIGVGLFAGAASGGRLREFWRFFQAAFPPAAEIVATARPMGEFRGAPLRTGLTGAWGRPGLLPVGEAIGTTYAATGEGIGKAMESGMVAAAHAADVLRGRSAHESLHQKYATSFREQFGHRYRAYRVAQRWASSPFVLNLLACRASAGRFAREELEALVSERGDAARLFSAAGLLRALVR